MKDTKYWLQHVYSGVDPELHGPYANLDIVALATPLLIAANPGLQAHGADDLFWICLQDGKLSSGAFSGGYMDTMRAKAKNL